LRQGIVCHLQEIRFLYGFSKVGKDACDLQRFTTGDRSRRRWVRQAIELVSNNQIVLLCEHRISAMTFSN